MILARDNMNMGVSGIIGILLVIALVVGLAAWAAYAYRNPHSASGQMLIRVRRINVRIYNVIDITLNTESF